MQLFREKFIVRKILSNRIRNIKIITVLAQIAKVSENESLFGRGGGRAPVNVTARYSRGCKKIHKGGQQQPGGVRRWKNPEGENP